jgi:hypothetical protein
LLVLEQTLSAQNAVASCPEAAIKERSGTSRCSPVMGEPAARQLEGLVLLEQVGSDVAEIPEPVCHDGRAV